MDKPRFCTAKGCSSYYPDLGKDTVSKFHALILEKSCKFVYPEILNLISTATQNDY